MSTSVTSDISAVLTTAFGPELIRLWNRRANALANCAQVEQGEFPSVLWAASTAGVTVKAVAEAYSVLSTDYSIDSMVNLSLPRAQYLSAFSLSDKEIAVAARSPLSPTKLMDMVSERVFEHATAITNRIDQDLFSGTGTDPVSGAQTIVGWDSALITSGTYAGQAISSVPALASNVSGSADSGTGTALTLAQLQADLTAIKVRSDEKPDFMVMHPYVGQALQALYETDRRIVNLDQQLTRYSSGPSNAFNGADSGLSFMGVPVLYDQNAYVFGVPGDGYGHIYYVSKRHNVLDVMPHMDPNDGSVWEDQDAISSGGADEPGQVIAPMFRIISLARTGLAANFAVEVECQLKVRRPLALGRRIDVAI